LSELTRKTSFSNPFLTISLKILIAVVVMVTKNPPWPSLEVVWFQNNAILAQETQITSQTDVEPTANFIVAVMELLILVKFAMTVF